MKRRIFFTICFLLAGFLMFSSGAPAAYAKDVIEIKAATHYPIKHRLTTDAFLWFSNEVENRTKGKVKFKWYHAGTLLKSNQTYDGLKSGIVDFAIIGLGSWEHVFPITNTLQMPYLTDSPVHATDIAWEMLQTMPEMKKEWSSLKCLGVYGSAMMNMLFKTKLPKTMEEMKGIKIAVFSGTLQKIVSRFGGVPQMIKPPDIYLGLQRGMVEGAVFPQAPARSWRITDLCSKHLMTNSWTGALAIAMRPQSWKKLPPDVKKVIEDLTPGFAQLCGYTLLNETDWVIEELKKRGDEFYYPTRQQKKRWVDSCKPIYDEQVKLLDSKGLKGRAIMDKILAIAEEKRKNPTPVNKDWWGRAGKKTGDGFISP